MRPQITHLLMEDIASELAKQIGVKDFSSLLGRLQPLKTHSPDMYAHSMRVGIYSLFLAQQEERDPKFALHGGCAHDIGKCLIPPEVLGAEEFGEHERQVMRHHPSLGFFMLKDTHPYSALVAGLHHRFQPNPYGISMLEEGSPIPLSREQETSVWEMAELVATADYFDAFTTREGPKTDDEIGDRMLGVGYPSDRVETLLKVQFLCGVGERWRKMFLN